MHFKKNVSSFCFISAMKKYIGIVCLLLSLFACHDRPTADRKLDATVAHDSVGQAEFPFPAIPDVLVEPADRRAYLLTHYWDVLEFGDTVLVNDRNVAEQGFVNFIVLLSEGGEVDGLVHESLLNWCRGFVSFAHARTVMMKLADNYLYNPNSPYYNEVLYGAYLQAMLEVLPADDAQRSALSFKLGLLERNRIGEQASDFTYYLPDGRRGSLYRMAAGSKWLVLVFYDPECGSCHEVLERMAADVTLAEAVGDGAVKVLAVYTEGNDEAWRGSLNGMPEGWTVVTDREQVKEQALYDLKALPSIYLLDKTGKVILKDVGVGELSTVLMEMQM